MSEAISSSALARLSPQAIHAGSDGRIGPANAAALALLGMMREDQLLGQDVLSFSVEGRRSLPWLRLEQTNRDDKPLRRSSLRLHDRLRDHIDVVPSWRRNVVGQSEFARFDDAFAR